MKNIESFLHEVANGKLTPTGIQNPFSIPDAIKANVGKTFSLSVDWETTFSADNIRSNRYQNGNSRGWIGSVQVTFQPSNNASGFTTFVSYGALAELLTNDKPELTVVANPDKSGRYTQKDSNGNDVPRVFYNIEPVKPKPATEKLFDDVLAAFEAVKVQHEPAAIDIDPTK